MKYIVSSILLISSVWMNLCYSQINYTDLKPDVVLIGSQSALYLNIDNDTIDDYALFHDTVFTSWPNDSGMVNGVAHFNENKILGIIDQHLYPRAIVYNYLMGPQSDTFDNFENNLPLFVYAMVEGVYQNWGYFQNMSYDKYIGIKFNRQGIFYYG